MAPQAEPHLGNLGPFPFKDCPSCYESWPLASYRGDQTCFSCVNRLKGI
jgi:hypothetical protein